MATINLQLEKYTSEAELSQNDWFSVYRGQREDGLPVLIKIIAPILAKDEFFRRRLKLLAQQLSELEHPNLVQTYNVEEEGERLCWVEAFVEARPLTEVIQQEAPLSVKRAQTIIGQIASVLDYIHYSGLLHGDLSGHHIFLDKNDHIYVTGFGQSQLVLGNSVGQQSYAFGSPEVMAPERVRGEGPSRPADLYSLGVIAYQLLAKQSPFSGPASSIYHAHAFRQARPLYEVNPGVTIPVSEVVGRMLSKSVDVRYNTAAEFARALGAARITTTPSRQFDMFTPIEERERRKQAVSFKSLFYLFSGLIVVLLIAALSAWTGYELALKQVAPAPAQTEAVIIDSTIPTPTPTADFLRQIDREEFASLSETADSVTLATPALDPATLGAVGVTLSNQSDRLDSPVQGDTVNFLNDPLLPPLHRSSVVTLRVTATLTPTVSPTAVRLIPTATPVPLPTPEVSSIPAGQGLFKFTNPTGSDLVVDVTGTHITSAVVPRGGQHDFYLPAGSYIYLTHTPGGKGLEPTKGVFDLAEGQTIDKDYYSDWQ